MAEVMRTEVLSALNGLTAALDLHDKEYPNGDWKRANSLIGAARSKTDPLIHGLQKWPMGRSHISNETVVRILSEHLASTG
jgi:hypothetical protein